MVRIFLLFAGGLAIGAGSTAAVLGGIVGMGVGRNSYLGASPHFAELAAETKMVTEPSDSEVRALEAELQTVSGFSTARDNARKYVLLTQIATVDLRRAIEGGLSADVDRLVLAELFRSFQRQNGDAALELVRAIGNPASRRTVALAAFEGLGFDANAIHAVTAALPPEDALFFKIEALPALAKRNLDEALILADGLTTTAERMLAFSSIGASQSPRDRQKVQESAVTIEDQQLRSEFISAAASEWAESAPEEAFVLLETFHPQGTPLTVPAYALLARADPVRALSVLKELAPEARAAFRAVALRALAEEDPALALAHIGNLPPGPERVRFGSLIASTFAREDPNGAVGWIDSVPYPKGDLFDGVLQGLQQSDSERALDLVERELTNPDPSARAEMRSNLRDYLERAVDNEPPVAIEMILTRIGEINNGSMGSVRDYVLSRWAARDPISAFELSLKHAEQLNVSTFAAIGSALASGNDSLAEQAIGRIPPAAQEPWVRSVVIAAYANDSARALDLALRVPGQELRDAALDELMLSQAASGTVDRELFPMIRNDAARQETSRNVAEMLAFSGNVALANQVAQAFIQDTVLRQEVLERIASGEIARDPLMEIQRSRRLRQGGSRD